MKQNAEILFINATLLTMDKDYTMYENGALAIQDGMILEVGETENLTGKYSADEIIDCKGKVLMPGLINAHTHLAMSLLRGLADDLRLDVWLLGYMMPVEREFVSPEFVDLGTKLSCIESIRSGVTCVTDMYYFESQVAEAVAEAGLRAVCSQTVLKFSSPDARSYEEGLSRARNFISEWKDHPLIVPSIAPHSPYTCTKEILQESTAIAQEFDVPLHIHIAETANEVRESINNHELRVVPYVQQQGIFKAKVIAAHCVHVDDGEIRTLEHKNAGVAHNPTSNLKLASGVAPISKMLELGVNVGIGTDGPASNNDLDMIEEVRLTALLAKGISGDPTTIPARTALAMATRIGAQAIHLGDITGSLEVGKKADLILIDITPLHNSPSFSRDPEGVYAQIVYAAKTTDVKDVMVNGKWLMRNREILTLDEKILLDQAKDYGTKIDAFLLEREQSVLSKLVAIGGASEVESFEVQNKVPIEDRQPVISALDHPDIDILYTRHYHEFDTYFSFEDEDQGMLRYREDEFVDDNGEVSNIRYRLTLIGPSREYQFHSDVLLSRSRYIAPATHSLRFYREYFEPSSETFIEKDRLRWRILYKGTEFYLNLDQVNQPDLGAFIEIKSRTWSIKDAEIKAELALELQGVLGASDQKSVTQDYIDFIHKT